jgi:hypothetical protein
MLTCEKLLYKKGMEKGAIFEFQDIAIPNTESILININQDRPSCYWRRKKEKCQVLTEKK